MPDSKPPCFAASAGGHLDLLTALAGQVLDGRPSVWVTSDTPRGQALRDQQEVVELVPEYGRSPLRLLANLRAAAGILRRHRPEVLVTSGAGVVVPFCLLARLFGARVVMIETMARVTSPSMSARVLSRIADTTVVQWPELRDSLPDAVVCRPALLEGIPETNGSAGTGTFVAVGTHEVPFDRMLGSVERAVADGTLPGPVRAQVGSATWSPDGVETSQWLARAELEAGIAAAEVVVCHAGAGIISSALTAGRRPIVVPRRAELGEHVDDHQFQLARKLGEWQLVVPVEESIEPGDVERVRRPLSLPAELRDAPSAADVLRAELFRDAA
jgi:UDP-N-acetylglucosamine--N-acetylmuramyl-(pentapeptide) pyrophosphoryl-undecaprenol N-acetylglucosamine transferase